MKPIIGCSYKCLNCEDDNYIICQHCYEKKDEFVEGDSHADHIFKMISEGISNFNQSGLIKSDHLSKREDKIFDFKIQHKQLVECLDKNVVVNLELTNTSKEKFPIGTILKGSTTNAKHITHSLSDLEPQSSKLLKVEFPKSYFDGDKIIMLSFILEKKDSPALFPSFHLKCEKKSDKLFEVVCKKGEPFSQARIQQQAPQTTKNKFSVNFSLFGKGCIDS